MKKKTNSKIQVIRMRNLNHITYNQVCKCVFTFINKNVFTSQSILFIFQRIDLQTQKSINVKTQENIT